MAVVDGRRVDETPGRIVYDHVRHGVPIRFVEEGSVFARTVRTTVSARFLVPAGPVFHVRARRGRRLMSHLGGGERPTSLESVCLVDSPRPAATRALFSARALLQLDELATNVGGMALESDGTEVSLRFPGQLSVTHLESVIALLVSLADADIFGLSELRALPGAHYHPPAGDYDARSNPWVELRLPARIELAPIASSGVAQTWAGRAYDHDQVLYARIHHGLLDPPIDRLPLLEDLRRHLTAVGEGVLAAREGTLTFTWSGVETRRPRLLAGARLLAAFDVPRQGLYR